MTETKDEPIKADYQHMWGDLITQMIDLNERGVKNIEPVVILDYMNFIYQRAQWEGTMKWEMQKHEGCNK